MSPQQHLSVVNLNVPNESCYRLSRAVRYKMFDILMGLCRGNQHCVRCSPRIQPALFDPRRQERFAANVPTGQCSMKCLQNSTPSSYFFVKRFAVEIICDVITGAFEVSSKGGDGHKGQDGGPGADAPDSSVIVSFLITVS